MQQVRQISNQHGMSEPPAPVAPNPGITQIALRDTPLVTEPVVPAANVTIPEAFKSPPVDVPVAPPVADKPVAVLPDIDKPVVSAPMPVMDTTPPKTAASLSVRQTKQVGTLRELFDEQVMTAKDPASAAHIVQMLLSGNTPRKVRQAFEDGLKTSHPDVHGVLYPAKSAIKPGASTKDASAKEPWQMTKNEYDAKWDELEEYAKVSEKKGKLDFQGGNEYLPMTDAEKAMHEKDWRAFSRSRGYSEDDINRYEQWHKISGQADNIPGAINDPWRRSPSPRRVTVIRKAHVERAVAEGKPVPPEVLAEFPDIKPRSVATTPEPVVATAAPAATPSKMIDVYHATDTEPGKGQKSGYYPGTYTYPDKAAVAEYGKAQKKPKTYTTQVDESKLYDLKEGGDALKKEAESAGFRTSGGSGHEEVQYLKSKGFEGMKRGNEVILFDNNKSKFAPHVEVEVAPTVSTPATDTPAASIKADKPVVTRAHDFAKHGTYHVKMPDGHEYRIFRDTDQFSYPVWHADPPPGVQSGLHGIGYTKQEAIEALRSQHNQKYAHVKPTASTPSDPVSMMMDAVKSAGSRNIQSAFDAGHVATMEYVTKGGSHETRVLQKADEWVPFKLGLLDDGSQLTKVTVGKPTTPSVAAKPTSNEWQTPALSTENATVVRAYAGNREGFAIKTQHGAEVSGYTHNADFPGEGGDPKRGELFLVKVPEAIRKQGIGRSLSDDALKVMRAAGAERVNIATTSSEGRALVSAMLRDGSISGPVKTSATGKAEYHIGRVAAKPETVVGKPASGVSAVANATPLYEAHGDENMVARVFKHDNGYAVSMLDNEAGKTVNQIRIFPTLDGARAHANTIKVATKVTDVTPKGYGPVAETPGSLPTSPLDVHLGTEAGKLRASINEANTILKGNVSGAQRSAIERTRDNAQAKLSEMENGTRAPSADEIDKPYVAKPTSGVSAGARTTKELTKAQHQRIRSLESKGYDEAYTADDGTPVMVLRDKKIYVEVLRNGSYRPASDRVPTAAAGTVKSITPHPAPEVSTGGIASVTTKTPGSQEADKLAKHIVEQMGLNGWAVGHPAFAARYRDMPAAERKNLLTALVDKGLLPKTYARTKSNFPTAYGLEQEVIGMAKAAEQAHKGVATNRHVPFTESEFYKKATGGGTQQSAAPATTTTKMGGDIKADAPSGIDDAKVGLDEMLKSRDTDGGKAIVAGRVLWAYDGNPQMQRELVKHLDDVAPGVRKYIQENHADTPKELSVLFGKPPVATVSATPATSNPTTAAEKGAKGKQMTKAEIGERIAVLLGAPSKAGGKPRVSFKTQIEEAWFRRGFEAANEKPGSPPPKQPPGVPAKEQKIHDAFAQGWSQAQIAIRSRETPAAETGAKGKPVEQMTREEPLPEQPPSRWTGDERKAYINGVKAVAILRDIAPGQIRRVSNLGKKNVENAAIALRDAAEKIGIVLPRRGTWFNAESDLAAAVHFENELRQLSPTKRATTQSPVKLHAHAKDVFDAHKPILESMVAKEAAPHRKAAAADSVLHNIQPDAQRALVDHLKAFDNEAYQALAAKHSVGLSNLFPKSGTTKVVAPAVKGQATESVSGATGTIKAIEKKPKSKTAIDALSLVRGVLESRIPTPAKAIAIDDIVSRQTAGTGVRLEIAKMLKEEAPVTFRHMTEIARERMVAGKSGATAEQESLMSLFADELQSRGEVLDLQANASGTIKAIENKPSPQKFSEYNPSSKTEGGWQVSDEVGGHAIAKADTPAAASAAPKPTFQEAGANWSELGEEFDRQDMVELIDKNSPGVALNFRALRKVLADKYVLSRVRVDELKFEKGTEELVNPDKAHPEKGAIVIGKDGLVADGRHRGLLARRNGQEFIEAYVPKPTAAETGAKGKQPADAPVAKEPWEMGEAEFGEQERQALLVSLREDLRKAKSGEEIPGIFNNGAKSKAALVRLREKNLADALAAKPETYSGDHLGHINKAIRDGEDVPGFNLRRYGLDAVADLPPIGEIVKLTKPGVGGPINIAGTVKKHLDDGRIEVRTQEGEIRQIAPSELGHKPKVGTALNPKEAELPFDLESARVGMDKRGYAEYGEHKVKVVPHPNGGADDKATFAVQHLLSDGKGGANRTILPTEYKSIEEAQNAALNELNARVGGKAAATAAPVASPESVIPKYTRQGVKESPSDRESRRVQIADLENRLRPLEKKYSDVSSKEAKTPRGHTKIKAKLRQEADSLGTQVGELRNAQRKLTREQDLQMIEDSLENPKSHEHYLKSLAEFHDQKRHDYREMTDSRQKSYALGRDGAESAVRNAEKHSLESDKYSNELIDRIKAKLPADKLNKDELQSAAEDVYRDFGDKTDLNRSIEASVARRLEARKDYRNSEIDLMTFLDDTQRAELKSAMTKAKEDGGPEWNARLDPIIQKGRTANAEASDANSVRVKADSEADAKQAEIDAGNAPKESRAKNAVELSGTRYIQIVNKRAKKLKGTVEKITAKGVVTETTERVLERETISPTWEIVKRIETIKDGKKAGEMKTVFDLVHSPTGLNVTTANKKNQAKQLLTLIEDQGIDLSTYTDTKKIPSEIVQKFSRISRAWEDDDLGHLNADEQITAMSRVPKPEHGLKADMILGADDMGYGVKENVRVKSAKINEKISDLAREVPEFAYNPVLTVTDDKRLLFRNGYRYEFSPEAFNLHPSELTPGKTIGINLADMGIARASEHDVVVESLKHAGFESVKKSSAGKITAIKRNGGEPTVVSQSKPEQWKATGVESKPVQELLDKIRWFQPSL